MYFSPLWHQQSSSPSSSFPVDMFPVWAPPAAMRRWESLRQVTSLLRCLALRNRVQSEWQRSFQRRSNLARCWDWGRNVSRQPLLGKWHQQQGLFGSEESLELIKFPALKMTYSDGFFCLHFPSILLIFHIFSLPGCQQRLEFGLILTPSTRSVDCVSRSRTGDSFLPLNQETQKCFVLPISDDWTRRRAAVTFCFFLFNEWMFETEKKLSERGNEEGRGEGAYPVSQPSRKSR